MSVPIKNDLRQILTSTEPLVEWLVKDFLPQGTLMTLAGEPGAGKSVLCYHLAICLACGIAPLGGLFPANPEGPVSVLYFDQENSIPDRNQYLKYAWEGLGKPDIKTLQTYLWCPHFQLGGGEWASAAADWIEAKQPRIIFYDTATPCFHVQDENSNAEATSNINTLRDLAKLTDKVATQTVLKHAKTKLEKDSRRTLRGAKAWEGAVDAIVFHTKTAGRPRADGLSMTKLEPAKTRAFGLRHKVSIDPGWIQKRSGLTLKGKFVLPGDDKKKRKDEEVDDNDEA
jgi:hypothetical protein